MTAIVVRENQGIRESTQASQVSPGRSQTNLATLQLASLLRQFMSGHKKMRVIVVLKQQYQESSRLYLGICLLLGPS